MEQPIEQRRSESLRRYSEEDVQGILERAFNLQGRDFTHANLVQMADELGISPAQLEEAEASWMAERESVQERARFRAHRQRELRQHITVFGIVNTFLLILNILASLIGVPLWLFLLPLLSWGMGLAFHVMDVMQKQGDNEEREFDRWLARRERQLARRTARHQARLGK